MNFQLKSRQVYLFFIAFIPLAKLFALPSLLSQTTGEDLWISTMINLIVDLLTLLTIIFVYKKTNCDFYTLLENNLGKVISKAVLVVFLIYFTLKAVLPLIEQRDYVQLTLYTLKPNLLYFLPFFILPFYFATKKLKTIGRIADVLWIISLNGILTLFALSIGNADLRAILPIGAHGIYNIGKGAFLGLSRFGDCVYGLFFIGEFSYKAKDGIKIFLSYLLGGVLVIAFMIIFYSVFTSIAFRQRFALTEISKYSTVINNLGRFDYIGIIMILFSNLFSLCLPIFFSCKIINKLFNVKKDWIAPIFTVSIQFVLCVLFSQYSVSIESFILNVGGIIFFVVGNVFPVTFCLFCKKRRKLNEKS